MVIGGGHGLATILRGLKNDPSNNLSAIVTVADDGGSTGRLRERYLIPAMGDIRNVMISLSESESIFNQLMNYRFEGSNEEDVRGHNLGNLILTALTQINGSFMESIVTVGKILNVKGNIYPASFDIVDLYARMEDDTIVKGESNIPNKQNRIKEVFYKKYVKASKEAVNAILEADYIIYAIGSLYTSVLPNIIVPKIKEALNSSKALKIYYCNSMTQVGETDGFFVENHVEAIQRHGANVDVVVLANNILPSEIVKKYAKKDTYVVDLANKLHCYQIMSEDLLDFSNGLVRHDPEKILKSFNKIKKGVI